VCGAAQSEPEAAEADEAAGPCPPARLARAQTQAELNTKAIYKY